MVMRIVKVALLAGILAAPGVARAQEGHFLPLLTYRTGSFASSGIPIADGMRDYFEMINQRDGGIGGVRIDHTECETGYDTKKGVECYEAVKGRNPLVMSPFSTGIALQLTPRAAVDKIVLLTVAYGLSASGDGSVFPWVFNPPITNWDGASVMVRYMASREGGLDKLKGKTLGLIHLDAPFGKEPVPVFEELAKKYGFQLKLYPIPPSDMQNQSAIWLSIRRDKPDFLYNQGWGSMNPTAVREAIRNRFPLDRMVGVWWAGGDDDGRAGGEAARGYGTLSYHRTGTDFPAIQDILKHVVDKKLSLSPRERVGENLYNRGVYTSMLIVEAIRAAQKDTGKARVSSDDVRKALEKLEITGKRLDEIGLAGFAAPLKLGCGDHNGHNDLFVSQWNGSRYVPATDWISPDHDTVKPLLDDAAKRYAAANPGWPARQEPCN